MNRPLFALLCAAAALAGWGGMAWWRGAHAAPAGKTATLSPADGATAPGEFARPAGKLPPGANPGIFTLAGALAQARALDPADPKSRAKLAALPPGAARDLALALFDSRARAAWKASGEVAAGDEFNPFADLPADAKPATSWADALRGKLLAGKPLREFAEAGDQSTEPFADPFGSSGEPEFDMGDITRWAALDPAAASETLLKMLPGKSRTAAVDAAAKVMSRDNPQAAWDLVLKSGEQKLGEGAARAWLEMTRTSESFINNPSPGLSGLQQKSLAETMTRLLKSEERNHAREFEYQQIWCLGLWVDKMEVTPVTLELMKAIAEREPWALLNTAGAHNLFVADLPASVLGNARLVIEDAQVDPLGVLHKIMDLPPSHFNPAAHPAVLNAAAPRLLPQLANAGHVKEAAQLLPRIPDPQQRRAALESILPQWMDADPAAARAAFNAAPFTALERERWQRHPAFLLNPASAGK